MGIGYMALWGLREKSCLEWMGDWTGCPLMTTRTPSVLKVKSVKDISKKDLVLVVNAVESI